MSIDKTGLGTKKSKSFSAKSLHKQLGASGIEYVVIVGIVVVALVTAFQVFDVGEFFTGIFTEIDSTVNPE